MEFFFAVFFLLFYYIRPQDWIPSLSGVGLIKPIIALWFFALVAVRSRPSPLPGLARTPHDWAMFAYLAYIVFFADAGIMAVLPLLSFYMLTVQSLNTWDRLKRYLKFWNGALIVIASFAVLTKFGIDITSAENNHFTQMGRMAINTWLHDNPNALGHSVVVAIPASYLLYFWKQGFTSRWVVFPILAGIAFYCAWLTQSKGAYLVGGATVVMAFVIGKPKWLQAIALSAAILGGIPALSFLPRMSEMGDLRSDEGVQGRLLAWEMAKTAEGNNPTGVGWNQFVAYIPWVEGTNHMIVTKATHSSYVQIGADLGRYGLFLYIAAIWCAVHTLLVTKSADDTQERCRRVLLIFLIANVVSGWMINRQYHTEYFLLIAGAAAMHRLRKAEELAKLGTPEETDEKPGLSPKTLVEELRKAWTRKETPAFIARPSESLQKSKPLWHRFGSLDLACSVGLTWLTLRLWTYVLENF